MQLGLARLPTRCLCEGIMLFGLVSVFLAKA